jgi:tetratricopeptide (TPR) repeat protein
MKTLTVCLALGLATIVSADEIDDRLAKADAAYRSEKFDDALAQLEPLLESNEIKQVEPRVRALAAHVLQARGEEHFRHARIPQSVADFNRQVQLHPDLAAEHWQRGIAYYYAEEYETGAKQFELHKSVNPQDVENAAWHFLCVMRSPKGSVEAARKKLIDVKHDARVPMAQVQQMFAGQMTPDDVLHVGEAEGGTAKFYADLYAGLYYEAIDKPEESLRLITQAAENPAAKNSYMGEVARVHVKLRKKTKAAVKADETKTAS